MEASEERFLVHLENEVVAQVEFEGQSLPEKKKGA